MNGNASEMLVFDFDGVIANSIHESFFNALNTHWHMFGARGLPLTGPIDSPLGVFDFEKLHGDFFKRFIELMPLGNRAEDYLVVLRIQAEEGPEIKSQSDFDAFKHGLDSQMLQEFHDEFYRARRKLQAEDPKKWVALVPPFEPVVQALDDLSKRFLVAIATAKDRHSVTMQLDAYGLSAVFGDRILDKDFAPTKRDHLGAFHKRFGTPYEYIHFIDDKVSHLLAVSDLGVQTYLSLWGFNGERERVIAREKGFRLLALDELPELGRNI